MRFLTFVSVARSTFVRRQTLVVNRTSYSVTSGESFTGGVARRVRSPRRIFSSCLVLPQRRRGWGW